MKEDAAGDSAPRRGGRPSQEQAGQIRDRILDIASDLFLTQGYGATSIEAIAKRAGISKRTFYHRFNDKADVFSAVAHRLITRLRPPQVAPLFKGSSLEDILQGLARVILRAALVPEALALHHLIISEASRFPELAVIMNAEASRQEAIKLIGDLLKRQAHQKNPAFAAEHFLQMIVSVPQSRASGLGKPMTSGELEAWAHDTVQLFLNGCRV